MTRAWHRDKKLITESKNLSFFGLLIVFVILLDESVGNVASFIVLHAPKNEKVRT